MLGTDGPVGHEWDGHILLLHASESERLAGLTAWVRRGLDRDEKVVCTEAADIAPERSLLAVLADRGVDVTAATTDGRLQVLPLDDFYSPAGPRVIVDRALAEGFDGVRLTAEAAAALSVLSDDAYLNVERDAEQLCRTRPVSALCQYERCTTVGARLCEVVAVHSDVRQSHLSVGADAHGTILAGQIDTANADMFAAALQAATSTADRVLWLDLGGVEFMDAAACGVLAAVTRGFRDVGGYVLLVTPQPSVERTLRLLDFDQLEGVEVIGVEQ